MIRSGPFALSVVEGLRHAVVVAGDPGVVHEAAHGAQRDVQPLAVHVRQEHLARAAIASHHRLPAADRARAEDQHRVSDADVEHLDAVQRAGEGIGNCRKVRRQVGRKWNQVLHGNRRN